MLAAVLWLRCGPSVCAGVLHVERRRAHALRLPTYAPGGGSGCVRPVRQHKEVGSTILVSYILTSVFFAFLLSWPRRCFAKNAVLMCLVLRCWSISTLHAATLPAIPFVLTIEVRDFSVRRHPTAYCSRVFTPATSLGIRTRRSNDSRHVSEVFSQPTMQ